MSVSINGSGDILTLSSATFTASPLGSSGGAGLVGFTPASGLDATTVQGAIAEVATSLSSSIGGEDKVFFQNGATVSTSYTIPPGYNAGTFGDVTIANGATVTITNGSSWTLV
jgi:hypothetical protein